MFDQTTDLAGRLLHRLKQVVAFPGFVKSASVVELHGDDQLPIAAYAMPGSALLPCHTPAATWLSTAFFLEQKTAMDQTLVPDVDARLRRFALYHGIENEANLLRDKHAEFHALPEDERLADEDYALVVKQGDVTVKRYYPLRNTEEVSRAGQYYLQYRDSMPYAARQQFASRVLEKAAAYGADLKDAEEVLTRAAGQGAVVGTDVAEILYNRVQASRHGLAGALGNVQVGLLKLAKMYAEHPLKARVPGVLIQLAETLDRFDRTFKLAQYYGKGLPRPEDCLFAVTKHAMAKLVRDNVETTTGNLYRLADLETLKIAVVHEGMGADYAHALSSPGRPTIDLEKAAEVLPTLPRPDAQLFDVLCQENGIRPWGKTAAANPFQLDNQQLLELASRAAAQREG